MQKIIGIVSGTTNSIVATMPGSFIIVIQFAWPKPLAPAVLCNPDPQIAPFDGINS
jgi:molecular chaperone DnaK (HSP70)